jgi:hypothetical protein
MWWLHFNRRGDGMAGLDRSSPPVGRNVSLLPCLAGQERSYGIDESGKFVNVEGFMLDDD